MTDKKPWMPTQEDIDRLQESIIKAMEADFILLGQHDIGSEDD